MRKTLYYGSLRKTRSRRQATGWLITSGARAAGVMPVLQAFNAVFGGSMQMSPQQHQCAAWTLGQSHRAQVLPFFTYVQYAIVALAAADFVYDPSRGADIGQHMRIQMLDLTDSG
ncbi:MAG: hypothetical protein ACREXO_10020 [Advenella sp.]